MQGEAEQNEQTQRRPERRTSCFRGGLFSSIALLVSRISPLFAPMDRRNFHHLIEWEECDGPRDCGHLSSQSPGIVSGCHRRRACAVALSLPAPPSRYAHAMPLQCHWCGYQRARIRKRKRDSNTFARNIYIFHCNSTPNETAAFRSRCNMIWNKLVFHVI